MPHKARFTSPRVRLINGQRDFLKKRACLACLYRSTLFNVMLMLLFR